MNPLTESATYRRRYYSVDGKPFDAAKKIELIVRVDGKELVHLQAREPGLLAFVSKPLDDGIELHVVEVSEKAYRDQAAPAVADSEGLLPWQIEALGLK